MCSHLVHGIYWVGIGAPNHIGKPWAQRNPKGLLTRPIEDYQVPLKLVGCWSLTPFGLSLVAVTERN